MTDERVMTEEERGFYEMGMDGVVEEAQPATTDLGDETSGPDEEPDDEEDG